VPSFSLNRISSEDTECIICFQVVHHDRGVVITAPIKEAFVTAGFLTVSVTLVIGVNFLPEICRAAEEKDDIIHSPKTFDDAVEFSLEPVQHFRELTGDNDYVVTKVRLVLARCTGLVCEVVSVDK
jgi:hypothetical protein